MNAAWLCAIGVGACNSAIAAVGKAAERTGCRVFAFSAVLFLVATGTALAVALARGGVGWGDWRLWGYGAAMGGAYLAAIALSLRAYRHWPPSVVWAAANAAFVVPILLSLPLLGEPLRWLDLPIAAGVGLMMHGLADRTATGGAGRAAASAARWLPVAGVFALNGLLMTGSKLFGRVLPDQASAGLVVTMYGSAAVLALAAHARQGGRAPARHELACGLGGGVLYGACTLCLLGAMGLPAGVAFPVLQGGSLVGGVLLCAAVFREPLTPRKLAALAVGIAAMALTAWR